MSLEAKAEVLGRKRPRCGLENLVYVRFRDGADLFCVVLLEGYRLNGKSHDFTCGVSD